MPSGTAVKTAELIREVRETKRQGAKDEVGNTAGARGAEFDGFRIHSVVCQVLWLTKRLSLVPKEKD